MTSAESVIDPQRLLAGLARLRSHVEATSALHATAVAGLEGDARLSGDNLLHYVALRSRDLRELQNGLTDLGLSSLGRSEAHVLDTLGRVMRALAALATAPEPKATEGVDRRTAAAVLSGRSQALFGDPGAGGARIMVTMPSEAAADQSLIDQLVVSGMTLARINCAHDNPTAWLAMIRRIRAAGKKSGREVRILVDLGGPKLRTGPVEPGPAVRHIRCPRKPTGAIAGSGQVTLVPDESSDNDDAIPVGAGFFRRIRVGDTIELTENRGRPRLLTVTAVTKQRVSAGINRPSWIGPGNPIRLMRGAARIAIGVIGSFPATAGTIPVAEGDLLVLTADGLGCPSRIDGSVMHPARIACQLPEVLPAIKPGQRVLFDDGKISGVAMAKPIRYKSQDGVLIRIKRVAGGKGKLREGNGINLPDTTLDLPRLTEDDRRDLAMVAPHADLVGVSFVRGPAVVGEVREVLGKYLGKTSATTRTTKLRRPRSLPGLVLKIETADAFVHLPRILLTGLAGGPFAVLLARGDLAVEVGFERLAELQEEILWLCEAAHVPVIWGTQVLETLVKQGLPTRAEVTDAAMSSRAECVMLNKGPHLVDAMHFLNDVLTRMRGHLDKKRAVLRRLSVSALT